MQTVDCWQYMYVFVWLVLSEFFVFANKLGSKWMNGLYSSCLRWCHARHYLSVCVNMCFFFCLRVPKTLLNPANLNSAEMVRIIRVWIGASVGSRYAGCWLMIPTPAALWLTPNCPSNIHRSSTPSIHHGAGSELIISLEPLSKPAPASRLYFLILFHLISGCLHFFFYFLFISSSRARLISSILFFFPPLLPKNHFTSSVTVKSKQLLISPT